MSTFKFNIQDTIVELDLPIVLLSDLLRTTLDTDLHVDKDIDGFPIVYIATVDDVDRLKSYYLYGKVSNKVLESFDRLLVEPMFDNTLSAKMYWLDKICLNKDKEIRTIYLPIRTREQTERFELSDIWKPVRKFQDYGILLDNIGIPETYNLIPISRNGPRGKCTIRYGNKLITSKHVVLDDVCNSAYETLKKYACKFTYLLVISDSPVLYSIDAWKRMYGARR